MIGAENRWLKLVGPSLSGGGSFFGQKKNGADLFLKRSTPLMKHELQR
jgi:hypothetical protein